MTNLIALPLGKREVTKAANRLAILEAAQAVFGELGYEAATVRDIIRRTGLASGTFYNYFRSKEELFEALSDDAARRLRFAAAARLLGGLGLAVSRLFSAALLPCPVYSLSLPSTAHAASAIFLIFRQQSAHAPAGNGTAAQ